ncbi:MAG TPA: GNAT family N-acetyltransferase [Acetobacteraceae bacterium]
MDYRDATEADLPAIVHLLADDRFGAGRERDMSPLPPSYLAGFRAMLVQGGRIMLAVQDGAVVGCMQFNVIHGVSQQGRSRAQVEGVRVDSTMRGRGIGVAMMRHAMVEARAAGCAILQLTTNRERTEAQAFYARLGFIHSHAGMKIALEP